MHLYQCLSSGVVLCVNTRNISFVILISKTKPKHSNLDYKHMSTTLKGLTLQTMGWSCEDKAFCSALIVCDQVQPRWQNSNLQFSSEVFWKEERNLEGNTASS